MQQAHAQSAGISRRSRRPTRGAIIAEMGRYAFPALLALAAAALGGAFFFRRRSWVIPYATALAVAVVVLCYSSQLLAIGRFYGLT